MSAAPWRFAGTDGGMHPAVLSSRLRSLTLLGLGFLIPLSVGLAISLQYAKPSILLAVALVVGTVAVVMLMTSRRLGLTVTIVVLYLGLLEGPVKLGTGGHEAASVVRDMLIYAVAAGALLRLITSRQRIVLPPLSGWVLAWVALVLIEALNPNTHGITKTLGGYRQQLEWVPFFFFGYALMRSKRRFRQMFLILGVVALANGIVSTYQTRLSPAQLASWGPGYRELVYGGELKKGSAARAFVVEGVAHIRPPALSTDAGFSAGIGVLALPGTLALLAGLGVRRRWPIVLLTLGCLVGIATGEGRLQVVGAFLTVLAFTVLSLSAGRQFTRPLAVILGIIAIALPLGSVFVSALGSSTFARYSSLESLSAGSKDTKTTSLSAIPRNISQAPFGVGLGTVGAATGFGGVQGPGEGIGAHQVSAETQYNFVVDELGLPGLILWVAFTLRMMVLALRGLPRIRNVETRIDLAAMLAVLIGFTLMGFSGPTMSSPAFGTFFWFTGGTFAFWFITRRRQAAVASAIPERRIAEPA